MPGCLDHIALISTNHLDFQMEADIDITGNGATDFDLMTTDIVRDTGQECDSKKGTMGKSSESEEPSYLTSSTPIVEKEKNGILLQMLTLRSNDSGFSEGASSSTPGSSVGGTPCTPLVSSSSDLSSPFAQPLQKNQPSLPDCDISPINRNVFPVRSRRFRHSDPCLRTLAMRIQLMEENDSLPKQSYSSCKFSGDSDDGESESKSEIDKITSITESSLKRNILHEVVERSRSCSRSLSSASDELEASLQEMSLEESSSESECSPRSLNSFSPAFSFPPPSTSRPQLPLPLTVNEKSINVIKESKNETEYSICDKQSDLSENETLLNTMQEVMLNSYEKDPLSSWEGSVDKLTFAATLSLTPKVSAQNSCSSRPTSSSDNKTVISPGTPVCDNDNAVVTVVKTHHDVPLADHKTGISCCAHLYPVCNDNTPSLPSESFTSIHSPLLGLNGHDCVFHSSQSSCPESNLLKSPTKRTSTGQQRNSEFSPRKVRRKMSLAVEKQRFSVRNVKRDLMSEDLLLPHPHSSQVERLPQFLNIGRLPPDCSADIPVSSKDLNVSSCELSEYQCGVASEHSEASQIRLQKVIATFSPPVPSRLIGHRIGIAKYDIVEELFKLNFFVCLENIFKHLSDSDLTSVANVSLMWRESLHRDPNSFQRYRKIRQATRKVKLLLGKENSPVKSKDSSLPGVTAAKGPLCTVQAKASQAGLQPCHSEDPELLWDDSLRVCPACYGPALVHPAENRATCRKESCAYNFCTLCFSAFHHPHPCKPLFHAASKTDLAGTRKSKKNLKRL